MIYRITNKLAKKIKEKPVESLSTDPNPFLDWSADHFVAGGLHHIVLMHNPSIMSLYFLSKGVTNSETFLIRANDNIRGGLCMYGFDSVYHTHIEPYFGNFRFPTFENRKLSGIMVDLVKHAKFLASYYDHLPFELTTKLNETPQC